MQWDQKNEEEYSAGIIGSYNVSTEDILADFQVHIADQYQGRAVKEASTLLLHLFNGQVFLLTLKELR